MKKILLFVSFLVLGLANISAQTSQIYYSGKVWPDGMWTWPWGYAEDPIEVAGKGYTPGTPAFMWQPGVPGDETMGLFFGFDNGIDLTADWDNLNVNFKLKAPNGVTEGDTLLIWIYDTNVDDWEHAIYMAVPGYQDLNDNMWKQFSLPLSDFITNNNDINKAQITAVSIEAHNKLIFDNFYIDDVFIGEPAVNMTQVMFNGKAVVEGVGAELYGFAENNFILAENEGFTEGTPAIVWENNNTDGWANAGVGFSFAPQDYSTAFDEDSVFIKIKAPAGINDLALVFWDQNWNTAHKIIDGVNWDGEWKELAIALNSFTDDGINKKDVYYLSIAPAETAIPERILLDDIWVGNPSIDFIAPPAPTGLLVTSETSFPYTNFIYWDDISSENGEMYNIYYSLNPITSLNGDGVFTLVNNVEEGVNVATHPIHYPLQDGEIAIYYAIEAVDAAGNVSESFTTLQEPFINTGKKRAIISMDPISFEADGDLSEWANVMPFRMLPEAGHVWGTVTDSTDFSAYVYVAMDSENLYVAIDVVDDLYTYKPENTQSWWEDEAIEFFFGLYDIKRIHQFMERGAEPDYRVVFKPYEMELLEKGAVNNGTENYYFEGLGESDYILEAKIPFSMIKLDEDSTFVPTEGITIPFEVFATDADQVNGGAEGRIQLGDNPALNPWGEGPDVWSFAWLGMPTFTDIHEVSQIPGKYYLGNNYPNPFNPSTTIDFSIARAGNVKLVVYNLLGQEVATLINKEFNAGAYKLTWNGTDNFGNGVSSGIYFYKIISGEFVQAKKMILLK